MGAEDPRQMLYGESKLVVSIGPLSLELRARSVGNPTEEQRLQGSEIMEDTRRAWPTESAKPSSHGLTETEAENIGPARVCTRSSVHVVAVSLMFLWHS